LGRPIGVQRDSLQRTALVPFTLNEMMDAAPPQEFESYLIALAEEVKGVVRIEQCRIRKSGLGYLMDIHVEVDGEMSVQQGHAIGHDVKDRLLASELSIVDVVVHIEPALMP
jgi:divalent metal cation (Fe/Co/Zn/Cd) transporter